MQLFLVRHGAVAPPRPRVFYGGTDVPLSNAGQEEARRAAAMLAEERLDRIVCSPLSRAVFGARCIGEGRCGMKPEVEEDLREIHRGRWVGLTPEEIRERFPGDLEAHDREPETWREHGGESLGDLRRRVLAVRDRLLAATFGQRVALVAHLFPIRAILADAMGLDVAEWTQLRIPTASVSSIEYLRAAETSVARVHWIGRKEEEAAPAG